MSKTIDRLPLARARVVAEDLAALLRPACDRVQIAGSIRRGRPDVGDVELVCIPKVTEEPGTLDMFGESTDPRTISRLDELCDRLLASRVLEYRFNKDGRKAWGSELKWGRYQGFPVDIYTATLETWGATLAIRTGPAKFSERLVTKRSQGGLCPDYLQFKGWRVRRRDTGEPLDTATELDVFNVLGLEYVSAEDRRDSTWPQRMACTHD